MRLNNLYFPCNIWTAHLLHINIVRAPLLGLMFICALLPASLLLLLVVSVLISRID